MRIFELAQALKTTSGELLRVARALDLDAHSTLSRLDDDDVQALKRHLAERPPEARRGQEAAQARLAAKRERATRQRDDRAAAERQALAAAIGRAREADARARGGSPAARPAAAPGPAAAQAAHAAPAAAPGPAAAPAAELPLVGGELKIEPLSPAAAEEKVIIHAAAETLESGDKAEAPEERDARASAEEAIDPDEEIATAYLGRQAKVPPVAKAHPMRPKETREADLPRPPSGRRAAAAPSAPAARP
ncbi:MAG: hypothetical protein GX571_06030, partial [Lentisphaerae bacterium]|nr:hypothetical protein [Lentisphaerota bacterium]